MEPISSNWGEHLTLLVMGGAGLSALAHAVNTFPTPSNKYGSWFLGVIQYIVGQRVSAANTLQGLQTVASGVTTAQKAAIDEQKGSAQNSGK